MAPFTELVGVGTVKRALRWLLILCLAGCTAGIRKQVTEVPGLKVRLLVVYPFGYRWPEPAYRSFELAERLVQAALLDAGDTLPLLGPGEFRVYRAEDDRAWASSDIVAQLPALHTRPEDTVILRAWAERLTESSRQEASTGAGKRVGAGVTEEVTYRGHVELVHPSTQTRLAELTAEVRVDPFAPHDDDSDPAPDLTKLMEQLTHEAVRTLAPMVDRPAAPPHALTLTFLFNPEAALDFQEPGRPPLRSQLATRDALEGEVLRQNRIRYANPGLTDTEAAGLSRLPGGMVVRRGSGRFQAMDVITTVDGRPALPQTLARARFSRTPVSVRVRKANGEWGELLLF